MVGKRLKMLRLERNLTQAQVAAAVGLSNRTISFYENEERFPPNDVLVKLADFFNVSTDYLLGRDISENSEIPSPIEEDAMEWIEAFKAAGLKPEQFKRLSEEDRYLIVSIVKKFFNDNNRGK